MGYQEWQQCIYFLEYVQGLTYFAWEPLCEGEGVCVITTPRLEAYSQV